MPLFLDMHKTNFSIDKAHHLTGVGLPTNKKDVKEAIKSLVKHPDDNACSAKLKPDLKIGSDKFGQGQN